MESCGHYCFICDTVEDHGNVSDDEEKACCVLLCEECYALQPDNESKRGISFGF